MIESFDHCMASIKIKQAIYLINPDEGVSVYTLLLLLSRAEICDINISCKLAIVSQILINISITNLVTIV